MTKHEEGNVNYVEMYKCDKCSILLKNAGLLRRHLKSKHSVQHASLPELRTGGQANNAENVTNTVKCDHCEHRARTKAHLMEHHKSKHSPKNHKCEECGMSATNQGQLDNHIKACHSKLKTKKLCKFWMKGYCLYVDASCRFEHAIPPQCRNGNSFRFWPNCRFTHDKVACRFQEQCLKPNCPFVHHFLAQGPTPRSPNINSHQEFPQFPQQMWRPW